jgi:single-strand DNA-binding protein
MNAISLIGRLVRDPETRATESGKMVTSITLAVDRPFAKDKTDFINCVCWDKVAEIIADSMSKGRQLGVSGYLQIRSFDGKDGQKRLVTEVVFDRFDFCGPKPTHKPAETADPASQFGQDVAPDEEIPF